MLEEQAIRIHRLEDISRVERERPDYVIRFERGSLVSQGAARLAGRALEVAGRSYEELDGFSAPVHVYRRRDAGGSQARPEP
jgi:hypothetical protein